MENINLKKIKKLVKEGYISCRQHPEVKDYYIYNYTASTQYDQVWNEETMNCRGLILDGKGNIIARPFPKFFNIGEYSQHSHLGKIPNYTYFDIFDKMDGSLGILYRLPNLEFAIATRGSFESEQAIKATKLFHKMFKNPEMIFANNWTYLFEIIYPENRIVVNYGKKEELVLLAVKNNECGEEYGYEELLNFSHEYGVPVTQYYGRVAYNRHAFLKLDEKILEGKEGFVLRFDNGLRVKIKSDEYCRLHRLLTCVSNKTIWEILRSGKNINELLERVPDEFYNWVKRTKVGMTSQYEEIKLEAQKIVDDLPITMERKDIAQEFNKHKEIRGLLFAILDNKDYSDVIWKMIKPEYSKPFSEEK